MSDRLLLNPRDAAKLLSISERTLWALTTPRGPIRAIRVASRLVRYSVADLERWISRESAAAGAEGPEQ